MDFRHWCLPCQDLQEWVNVEPRWTKLICYRQLHLRHQHLASLHKFQAKAFRKPWASTPANARSSISKKLGTASANPLRNFSETVYEGTCIAKMLWLQVELFLLPRHIQMVRIFEIQFPLDYKSFHVSMLFCLGRTSTNFKQPWVFLSTGRVPATYAFLFLKHAVFLLNQFSSDLLYLCWCWDCQRALMPWYSYPLPDTLSSSTRSRVFWASPPKTSGSSEIRHMHYFSEGDRGKFSPTSAQLTAKCGRPDKIKQQNITRPFAKGLPSFRSLRQLQHGSCHASVSLLESNVLSVSRACTVRTLNV